ncbi:hypothetical protein [Ewingella americana]|nr:hypothetical protein [Ewingella americana]
MSIISKDTIPVSRLNLTEFKAHYAYSDIESLAANIVSEMMDLPTLHTAPTFVQVQDKIFTYNPTRIKKYPLVATTVGSPEFLIDLQAFLSGILQTRGDRFIDQLLRQMDNAPRGANRRVLLYTSCYVELVARQVKLNDHNRHDLLSIISDVIESGSMPVQDLRGFTSPLEPQAIKNLESMLECLQANKPLPENLFGPLRD